ncbi:MAG: hypothetical protein ACYCYE_13135 [Clostridia bacterium]
MFWGFDVVSKLGVTYSPGIFNSEQSRVMEDKREKAGLSRELTIIVMRILGWSKDLSAGWQPG